MVDDSPLQKLFDEVRNVYFLQKEFDKLFKNSDSIYQQEQKTYPEKVYLLPLSWWNKWANRVAYDRYVKLTQ